MFGEKALFRAESTPNASNALLSLKTWLSEFLPALAIDLDG